MSAIYKFIQILFAQINNRVEHFLWSICWFQDQHCVNKLFNGWWKISLLQAICLHSTLYQSDPDGKPSFLHLECPHETFPRSFFSPSSITVKGPPESPIQEVAPSAMAHCWRDVKFCNTQVLRHSSVVIHWIHH